MTRTFHFLPKPDLTAADLAKLVEAILGKIKKDSDSLTIRYASPQPCPAVMDHLPTIILDDLQKAESCAIHKDEGNNNSDFILYLGFQKGSRGYAWLVLKGLKGCKVNGTLREAKTLPHDFMEVQGRITLRLDCKGGKNPHLSEADSMGEIYDLVRLQLGLEPKPCIALALSGGGFRSTLFHLGLIKLLRDTGCLGDVAFVAAVSGGSVLAAHLATNWNVYVMGTDKEFQKKVEELLKFMQEDVRGRIVKRWIICWAVIWLARPILKIINFFRKSRTSYAHTWGSKTFWLARAYKNLFKNQKLRDLRHDKATASASEPPETFLLATSLGKGALCSFHSRGITFESPKIGDEKEPPTPDEVPYEDFPLVKAVAASSAFPPLFNPLLLSSYDIMASPVLVGFEHEYLTDGGVFDNLGLSKFWWTQARDRQQGVPMQPYRFLVVSDASSPFDIKNSKSFKGILSRNVRATDILMKRVSELENLKADEIEKTIIRETIAQVEPSNSHSESTNHVIPLFCRITNRLTDPVLALRQPLQSLTATLRTDLDCFSELEIRCLVHHGYTVARSRFVAELKGEEHSNFKRRSEKSWQGLADYDHQLTQGSTEKQQESLRSGENVLLFRWSSFVCHWGKRLF